MPTVNITLWDQDVASGGAFADGNPSAASFWNTNFHDNFNGAITAANGAGPYPFGGDNFFSYNAEIVDDGATIPVGATIIAVNLKYDYSIDLKAGWGSGTLHLDIGENDLLDTWSLTGEGVHAASRTLPLPHLTTRTLIYLRFGFPRRFLINLDTNGSGFGGNTDFTFSNFRLEVEYSEVDPPTVNTIDPEEGPTSGGTAFTIDGDDFVTGASVLFDGIPATSVVVVDPQTITGVTPPHPASFANVKVVNPDEQFDQLDAAFEFVPTPAPPLADGTLADARRDPAVSVHTVLNDAPDTATWESDETDPVGTPIRIDDPIVGTIHRGVIVQQTLGFEGQRTQQIRKNTATDLSYYLNRRHPYGTFEDVSATDVVIALISEFAPDFNTDNVEAGLPNITIKFNRSVNVGACLTAICQLLQGAKWYVDNDFGVHLFISSEPGDQPDEVNDSNTDLLRDGESGIEITTDLSQIRTRVYVKGAGNADGSGNPSAPYYFQAPGAMYAVSSPALAPGVYYYQFTLTVDDGETGSMSLTGIVIDAVRTNAQFTDLGTRINSAIRLDPRIQGVNIYRDYRSADGTTDVSGFLVSFGLDDLADGEDYIDTADAVTGIDVDRQPPGPAGDLALNVWHQEDDIPAQQALAAIEGGDGIHEYYVSDPSITTQEMAQERALAELALFKNPIRTVKYQTRDEKSRVGKDVVFNLSDPPIVGTFRIQEVQIDQMDEGYEDGTPIKPRFTVQASSVRYTLEDLLRRIDADGAPGGSGGGGSAGSGAPPTAPPTSLSARMLSPGAEISITGDVTADAELFTGADDITLVTALASGVVTTGKIADDAVTNAKLANMTGPTIKGRISGTGDPQDLTPTQATALLDEMVGDAGSGGLKGLVPAPAPGDATLFLRGDGEWAMPVASGGDVEPHALLDGVVHNDTEAGSPQLGDLIMADAGGAAASNKTFFNGLQKAKGGSNKIWVDGLPYDMASGFGSALWKRLPIGPASYVLTSDGEKASWEPSGGSGSGVSAASVYRSSNFTLLDTTLTAVSLNTEEYDDDGYWAVGSPTRFTVPAGGGTFRLLGQAEWQSSFVGIVYARIYKNGVKIAESTAPGGAGFFGSIQVSKQDRASAGDYYEFYLYQAANTPGTASTILGGAASTFFQIARE